MGFLRFAVLVLELAALVALPANAFISGFNQPCRAFQCPSSQAVVPKKCVDYRVKSVSLRYSSRVLYIAILQGICVHCERLRHCGHAYHHHHRLLRMLQLARCGRSPCPAVLLVCCCSSFEYNCTHRPVVLQHVRHEERHVREATGEVHAVAVRVLATLLSLAVRTLPRRKWCSPWKTSPPGTIPSRRSDRCRWLDFNVGRWCGSLKEYGVNVCKPEYYSDVSS
jgi:hypothetical protein